MEHGDAGREQSNENKAVAPERHPTAERSQQPAQQHQ